MCRSLVVRLLSARYSPPEKILFSTFTSKTFPPTFIVCSLHPAFRHGEMCKSFRTNFTIYYYNSQSHVYVGGFRGFLGVGAGQLLSLGIPVVKVTIPYFSSVPSAQWLFSLIKVTFVPFSKSDELAEWKLFSWIWCQLCEGHLINQSCHPKAAPHMLIGAWESLRSQPWNF